MGEKGIKERKGGRECGEMEVLTMVEGDRERVGLLHVVSTCSMLNARVSAPPVVCAALLQLCVCN